MIEKEFLIDDILSRVNTKKIPLKKSECSTCKTEEFEIPARTATTQNQGLSCYVPRDCATVLKNKISVSANGDYCAFWHDEEFTILQDSYALEGKYHVLNSETALYIISAMHKALAPKYNWNNKSGWEKIRKEVISLPVLIDAETNQPKTDETRQYHKDGYIPDWEYMQERIKELEQERIKELEQERIKELEQYLIVTGLNDYELSEEDKEVLATKLFDGGQLESSTSGNGYLKEVRMFQLDELGAIEKVKGRPLKEYSSGTIPFVTGSQNDNGVVGYIDAPIEAISKGNCIVIDPIKGMCMYHPDDFVGRGFSGASVNALYIDKLNDVNALYICSAIEKYSKQIASYTNLFNSRRLATAKVALPIQTDSSNHPVIDSTHKYHPEGFVPDWEYMENYIRAMEKVVIRDVVVWKDEMIEKTKMVVEE